MVVCRCRPWLPREEGTESCVKITPGVMEEGVFQPSARGRAQEDASIYAPEILKRSA